jgi:hypothetical protein
MIVTRSDIVVETLARAGGIAARTTILAAASTKLGRREAGLAIAMAILAGRIRKVLLADGILGLELTSADDHDNFTGQLTLPEEPARGLAARDEDPGARRDISTAAGAESPEYRRGRR